MPNVQFANSVWSDRLGSWTIDVPALIVQWSGEALAIVGSRQAPQTLQQMLDLVHADWCHTVGDAITDCVRHGTAFDVEVRMKTAKALPLWVRMLGEARRDGEGTIDCIRGTLHDVSGKMAAADQFRELSDQLTTTLESLTDAFFTVDADWRFTYVNRRAEALFRHAREELLGRLMWDVFPASVGTAFYTHYQQARANMEPTMFEAWSAVLQLRLEVAAYPSKEGLAVYFRDVTESRAVRQALLESEERYRLLFESSADAIFELVADGGILRANPAACLMFGMTEAQIRHAGAAGLVAPDDKRLGRLLSAHNKAGKAKGELTVLPGDGTRLEVEATVASYTTREGTKLLNVVLRDITERLRHQQEVLQLNSELNERVKVRTAQLESANAELKSFAHALAHDLRAPIATIQGFGAMLGDSLERLGPEQVRHYVQRIRAAARQMDEFVDALLAMASIAQTRLDVTEVDLSAAARSVLADLQEREPQRQVRSHVQDGMVVQGDARLLRMAVENLVGNAWKFSRGRAVSEISLTRQDEADGKIVYCLRDNGAGFDMAFADKLFGNFQRLHSQAEFPGTGIGLANVKRIVGQHGGRVWGESPDDAGATFKFTLDASADDPS